MDGDFRLGAVHSFKPFPTKLTCPLTVQDSFTESRRLELSEVAQLAKLMNKGLCFVFIWPNKVILGPWLCKPHKGIQFVFQPPGQNSV